MGSLAPAWSATLKVSSHRLVDENARSYQYRTSTLLGRGALCPNVTTEHKQNRMMANINKFLVEKRDLQAEVQ